MTTVEWAGVAAIGIGAFLLWRKRQAQMVSSAPPPAYAPPPTGTRPSQPATAAPIPVKAPTIAGVTVGNAITGKVKASISDMIAKQTKEGQ
jgi:hypothetical protein